MCIQAHPLASSKLNASLLTRHPSVLIPEDTKLQWRDAVEHIRSTLASSRNHCVILLAEGWASRSPSPKQKQITNRLIFRSYTGAHARAVEVLHRYQPPQPAGSSSHAARDAGGHVLRCDAADIALYRTPRE
jgi:6-phosphofructokinase